MDLLERLSGSCGFSVVTGIVQLVHQGCVVVVVVVVSLSQPLGDMNHFTAVGAITKIVACCGVRR